MKKIIAGLILILLLAGIFVPFANGLLLEKIVTRMKNDLNDMYADKGSDVSVEIVNFDRKFFSSEIEWKVRLGNLAAVYGVEEILLIDHAKHGFTGVVSQTSLEKNQWFNELIKNELNGNNPLKMTTIYKITGNIESVIEIDAFSFQAEGETVDIRPGRIETVGNEGLTRIVSEAKLEGLSVKDRLRMEGLSLQYDLERISSYIWDGDITYKLNSLIIDDNKDNFALKNFQGEYSLDCDQKNNTLSIGSTIEIDSFTSRNQETKDSFLQLDVVNLDANGYEEFMELYTDLVQSMLDEISTNRDDPEKLHEIMQERTTSAGLQMIAAYEKLLKKGLKITISDLHAQLPQGKLRGKLELQLNRDISFAQLVPIATQPNLAFEMVSLQSFLSIPAELAGDKPQLTTPAHPGMKTGLFVVEGSNLVHEAQTKDGKLFLNGHEVVFN